MTHDPHDELLDRVLGEAAAQERGLTPPASVTRGAALRIRRRRRRRVAGCSAALLLAVGGGLFWNHGPAATPPGAPVTAARDTPPAPVTVAATPPAPPRVEVVGHLAEPVKTRRPGVTVLILHKLTPGPPPPGELMNQTPLDKEPLRNA